MIVVPVLNTTLSEMDSKEKAQSNTCIQVFRNLLPIEL